MAPASLTFRQLWRGALPAAVGALLLGGALVVIPSPALAQAVPGKTSPERALPELKALELEKLVALQALNRRAEQCVRKANSLKALHQCHRQARQAHQTLHTTMRQRMATIRQRYGLPMPKPRPGYADQKGGPES